MKDKNNLEPSDYKTGINNTLNEPNNFLPLFETKMTKQELSPLERAKFEHSQLANGFPNIEYLRELDEIEKKLKVLEIIKEKKVDVVMLKTISDFATYNEHRIPNKVKDYVCVSDYMLTQEEFDLLKEVLK